MSSRGAGLSAVWVAAGQGCRAWLGVCAVCALTLSAPWPVAAQEPSPPSQEAIDEAARLYRIGQLHFEGKEFGEAARSFVRAFELDPNPVLAFNVARAYENDGRRDEAREYYQRALDFEPEDEVLRAKCESSLVRLQRVAENIEVELAEREGELVVTVDGGGAVLVDGEPRGDAPLKLALPPGEYLVEVRRTGFEPFVRDVKVEAASMVVIDAVLEERFEVAPWVAWTGGGLLLASAVLGGAGVLYANEANDAFEQAQSLEVQRDPERFARLRDEGERARLLTLGFYSLGGAAALAGVSMVGLYVWFPAEEVDVVVAPSGVVLQGRF